MNYRSRVYIACIGILVILSCRTRHERLDRESSSSSFVDGLSLVQMSDLNFSTVNPMRLDLPDFRVNGIRVGIQPFILYDTPIISYQLPSLADYIQILRCPSNRVIDGGANILQYVEDKANAEEENRIFQANEFWQAALKTPFCELVGDSFSDPFFRDPSAPTGKYFYYIRACVDPVRLEKSDAFGTNNCSRQVTRSVEFSFTSKRRQTDLALFKNVAELENRQSTLSRQIIHLSQVLGSSYVHCQELRKSTVASQDTREAIVNYSALAGGVAGALGGAAFGVKKLSNRNGKAVGGAVGGTLGAASGALVTMLMSSGIDAMVRPLPSMAGEDAGCYTDKTQAQIDSLVKSYQQEAALGTTQTRNCSCGDVNALVFQIQAMQKQITDIDATLATTLARMNTDSTKNATEKKP